MDCNCMGLVAAGWCTRKWLRFDRTIRNLTSGDMVNPACGDSTGNKQIKKDKVVYLLDLFEGSREKGQCDLGCGVPLDDWANASLC